MLFLRLSGNAAEEKRRKSYGRNHALGLSGGQQQRLCIARALAVELPIFFRGRRIDAAKTILREDLLMTAKYLEKVGDHAVNIAEWEIFRETGSIDKVRLL